MVVRTRFAPSPTGFLHVGGVRTALFCWLLARRTNGEFILRIEDTDQARSTDEAIQVILEGLEWLGLSADLGPIRQTERVECYRKATEQLLSEGHAYHCYCSTTVLQQVRDQQKAQGLKPRYDRRCRDGRAPVAGVTPIVRFKNPLDGTVKFDDLVRGSITVANAELDDLVIARSDGMPTYNFAVVVDDSDMGVTHVVRGDDHINNTPRQINIFRALDRPLPLFAHVPMILGSDGARLSKRHGAVSVLEYRNAGYLPEALLNYLVRLGWSHGDQEIFSLDELVQIFDLKDVNRAPSTFNTEKLDWVNQHYIKSVDVSRLAILYRDKAETLGYAIESDSNIEQICEMWRERVSTINELVESTRFFFEVIEPQEKARRKHLTVESASVLQHLQQKLSTVGDWSVDTIKASLQETATELDVKFGKIGAPTRIALTGVLGGAELDQTIHALGQRKVDERLIAAVSLAKDA